jgi:hypothetical protein
MPFFTARWRCLHFYFFRHIAPQRLPFGDCQLESSARRCCRDVAVFFEYREPLADGSWLDTHIPRDGRQESREGSGSAIGVDDEVDVEPKACAHGAVMFTGRLNCQATPNRPPPVGAAMWWMNDARPATLDERSELCRGVIHIYTLLGSSRQDER